jgi:predicted ATPase/class 3 adenylate cyclase
MKCTNCGQENPPEALFCMKCAAKLERKCPQCGASNPGEALFCMRCAAKLDVDARQAVPVEDEAVPKLEDMQHRLYIPEPLRRKMDSARQEMEGENRLVTALFADISGFTPMSQELDPEATVEKVNQCFQMITDAVYRYEGSVNRFIGDCVLAFFGAPLTHENDPERAILAALDMREAVSKLGLDISVGINTGMMYFGAIGTQEHQEISAYGADINLAKRFQETAQPGQILVGEGIYRLTRRAFEFQPLSALMLKGIAEPVSAYAVMKVLPRPEKIRGIEGLRAEMIGREREFADLKECADELLAGRGQIVSIIGEAGVGKSRLVTELKGYIRDKDIRWLEGRCVSIGESIGYWVFIDILRSYLEFSGEDATEDRREKILEKMKSLFPQRWEEIVPYIGNLLSVRFGNQWDDRIRYLPPEQVKHQTFLTLRSVFLTLAQQKPLLLILEDMHWADNLSLDLLNLLMDDLILAPLMLLCVYRPDREHRSWHISAQASAKCLDRYTEMTLRPLNAQESRRLVESLLSIDNLSESVRGSILQKAEGNPFFVEEVIRSLIESGVVYQDGERWVAKEEVEDIAVPDTIQSVIMARIDRLEEEVRYVLQSAAVIGRLFRHKLLGYTTQQERNLDRYLWQLEERDLVYEEHAIPELQYSFKHVLTQETAYNTILSRRRREFHRKVAEGYEALYSSRIEEYYEELAYHYSRSDDRQKALHYLVKAGDKSREAFANEEAIAYYNQALKLMDEIEADRRGVQLNAPTIGHIYQSLGEIYFPLTRHEEALECCRKALEYTTDKKDRARIYGAIGFIYQRDQKFDLAFEHLNAGIAELGDDTESPEMARICIPLSWATREQQHDSEEAIEIARRGLKIVEGTEHYFEIVELYNCLINHLSTSGDIDKAFEYARKSVEVAQKSGNSYLIAYSTEFLGLAHWRNGEGDVALKLVREALEIYEKIGHSFGISSAYIQLFQIYAGSRDWDAAVECFERSEVMTHPSLHPWFMTYSRIYPLAWAYLQKGNTEKAIEYSQKALGVAEISNSMSFAQSLGVMEEAFAVMGKQEQKVQGREGQSTSRFETDPVVS